MKGERLVILVGSTVSSRNTGTEFLSGFETHPWLWSLEIMNHRGCSSYFVPSVRVV